MKRTILLTLALTLSLGALASGSALAQSAKDKKIGKKTDPYVRAINGLSSTVFGKRSQYAKKFADWKVGPTCDPKEDRSRMYPFNKGFLKGWIKELSKANKRGPKMKELEAAAKGYIKGLKALQKPWANAVDYYATKKQRGDKCKKGRKYHAKISAAYVTLADADRAMRKAVDAIQEARADKVVKSIAKKYGKRIRYHHRKGMIEAKRALVVFQTTWDAKKPVIEPFKAHLKTVEALDASGTEYAKTYRAEASSTGFTNYTRSFRNYTKALQEALERLDGTKPFTKRDMERMKKGKGSQPRGSYSAVVKSFNSLVNTANRMRYGKKVR